MKTYQAELVLDARAKLGEGPSWDAQSGKLLWVDIEGFMLHQYDPITGNDDVLDVGEHIGAVVPYIPGEVIAALESGLYRIELASGTKTLIHDPEEGRPGNRFNDGKCDPNGRLLAGTMSLHGEDKQGAFYSMDQQGNVRLLLDEVSTSNGLAWSSDGRTLYYIDTPTLTITAFDYDLDSGDIADGRAVVQLDDSEGFPDGMTIDAEGMLWVARWGGNRVTRINPSNGEIIGEVNVPASCVTSCVFGGPELDTLYITTARGDGNPDEPHAGSLFQVKPDVRGTATIPYNQVQQASWSDQ
ncbi:SMP-30/gluconolactonase/LRE family protein [Paenibacillus sp. WLX2291]|uniref:SMP-30/gluconolactonase/LRE family protein n=1 Tax=Paenibacillus sp. WLX2291 TaxID=3296934 RepID=UPI003983E5C3